MVVRSAVRVIGISKIGLRTTMNGERRGSIQDKGDGRCELDAGHRCSRTNSKETHGSQQCSRCWAKEPE